MYIYTLCIVPSALNTVQSHKTLNPQQVTSDIIIVCIAYPQALSVPVKTSIIPHTKYGRQIYANLILAYSTATGELGQ